MNPEEIENSFKDHSNQLIRLDERIKNLDGINERVARLNNYFQICGVLLLLLGIGGGFLVSRFFDAQREIARLTAQVTNSEKILSSQVKKAKADFDSHVTTNPILATLQAKVTQFETAFATADTAPNGGKISRQRQGSEDDGTDTITCPQGTYLYGIRVGSIKAIDTESFTTWSHSTGRFSRSRRRNSHEMAQPIDEVNGPKPVKSLPCPAFFASLTLKGKRIRPEKPVKGGIFPLNSR
jgi:hypothetical protein